MKQMREATVAAALLIDLLRYMERGGVQSSEVARLSISI